MTVPVAGFIATLGAPAGDAGAGGWGAWGAGADGGLPMWVSAALFLAGLTLLAITIVAVIRRHMAGAAGADPLTDDAELGRRRLIRRHTVDPVLADAEELAETLAARLNEQADRLERLMREADARIARLDGLTNTAMVEPKPAPAAPGPTRALDGFGEDPITRQVYQLADQGQPAIEIAKRLGQHTGKVELILALRRA